jgi:TRAP-type C4-dicarboxylate transport system permease large subunit
LKALGLSSLGAAAVAGSFLILGTRPDAIAGYYQDKLTPTEFSLWLSGLVIATLSPPSIALVFWSLSKSMRHGWLFHVLLLPATYVCVRGAIATMLFVAGEPDSDGLTGWATDPATILALICPAAYYLALLVRELGRPSLSANGS